GGASGRPRAVARAPGGAGRGHRGGRAVPRGPRVDVGDRAGAERRRRPYPAAGPRLHAVRRTRLRGRGPSRAAAGRGVLMTNDDTLELEAIKRLKYRYARNLDLKDWDEVRACFTKDATAAYSGGK